MTDKEKNNQSPAVVEKFVIRLPTGLRNQIKALSEKNRRSMNSEIIMVLEKHIRQNRIIADESIASFAEDDIGGVKDLLTDKLDNLPPGKKEALLELLD